MPVFGPQQSLPGEFRSNHVTSGSLPLTWGHVTSFPVTWLLPPASYSLVEGEMYSIRVFGPLSHFQVTSVKWWHFRSTFSHLKPRYIISCHVTASSCKLQPCRKWNVQYMLFFALYSHFQVTSGQMTSLAGHFHSPEVTWRDFLSCDIISCHVTAFSHELQPCRKWNVQYMPVFGTLQPLQVTSGQNDVTSGSPPSPEVTWRHFLSRDCLLLRAAAL